MSYWNPSWILRSGSLMAGLSRGCMHISIAVPPNKFHIPTYGHPEVLWTWRWGLRVFHFRGFSTRLIPKLENEVNRTGTLVSRNLYIPLYIPLAAGLLLPMRRLLIKQRIRKSRVAWLNGLSVVGLVVCLLAWPISYWPTWWQVSDTKSIGLTEGCVAARTSNRIATTGPPYFPPSGSPLGLELTLVLRDWFNIQIHPHRGWDTVWVPQIKVDYYRMPGGRVSSRCMYLPLWMPIVLFSFLPAVRVIRQERRKRRTLAAQCPECGYDLRGTPVRCSECGCEADIETLTRHTLSSRDKQNDSITSHGGRRGIVSDDFRETGFEPQIPIGNTITDVKGEQNES